ncbi:MAG: formate/nitrite transporter family protein [Salinisphaera sp.]|nr:formate/nitrite transporter family protein [Salinisphaera sp.]
MTQDDDVRYPDRHAIYHQTANGTPKADEQEVDLDHDQQRDARRREAPSAGVVFEAIRAEAENELVRPLLGLAWSGLAAGLSMGFSFLAMALLSAHTPDANWQRIVTSLGYSTGFLFVILGRQQLFTENTLTPVLEVLRVRDLKTVVRTLKLWGVVLGANVIGTGIFAAVMANIHILPDSMQPAMDKIAAGEYEAGFVTMMARAVFAGWLIALMLWLMPAAETARVGVIIIVTYLIGLAHFPHIIAGSVAALYGVFSGAHSIADYLSVFFLPTLIGNVFGGVLMVAVINYAQVAYSDSRRQS